MTYRTYSRRSRVARACMQCCGSCAGRSVAVLAARAWATTLFARRSVDLVLAR